MLDELDLRQLLEIMQRLSLGHLRIPQRQCMVYSIPLLLWPAVQSVIASLPPGQEDWN